MPRVQSLAPLALLLLPFFLQKRPGGQLPRVEGDGTVLNLVSKFGLLIVVLAIAILLMRHSLLSPSPLVIALQLAAVGLSVWARVSFGKGMFRVTAVPSNGPLLKCGPYRVIRHPMYAAALLFIWSSVGGHWSVANAIIGLFVTVGIALRIAAEERLLCDRYPDYVQYSRGTKRVIPFLL
jgi:protein-S-isoprenylcysteine O-methyltransferase Ste14